MSDNIDHIDFTIMWEGLLTNTEDATVEYITEEEFRRRFDVDANELFTDIEKSEQDEQEKMIESDVVCEDAVPSAGGNEATEFLSLSTEDVTNFIEKSENKNTMRKTHCDLQKFYRFLLTKGETREIHHIDVDLLDEYVANFVLSIRKNDGTEYEPSTLRNFLSSLDRKLRRHKYPHAIMTSKGPHFALTRDALKAKQKTLKKMGKGNKPKEAQPLTLEEINILYEKGILGTASPQALLNTLWMNNMLHFGLRGTLEQYNLRWGDVTLKAASDGTEYLELNERQTKTRTGENLCDVRTVAPKMFACEGERNPISVYKQYLLKRPVDCLSADDPFYVAPRTVAIDPEDPNCIWFKKQNVGVKKLGSMLKSMAQAAGLNPQKLLTNHSVRKHLVQTLRDANVPPTEIMQISGHKNVQSILNYSNISESKQKQCSNILSSGSKQNTTSTVTAPTDTNVNSTSSAIQPATSVELVPHTIGNSQLAQVTNVSALNVTPGSSNTAQFPTQYAMSNRSITQSYGSLFFGATINVQNFNVYAPTNPSNDETH